MLFNALGVLRVLDPLNALGALVALAALVPLGALAALVAPVALGALGELVLLCSLVALGAHFATVVVASLSPLRNAIKVVARRLPMLLPYTAIAAAQRRCNINYRRSCCAMLLLVARARGACFARLLHSLRPFAALNVHGAPAQAPVIVVAAALVGVLVAALNMPDAPAAL